MTPNELKIRFPQLLGKLGVEDTQILLNVLSRVELEAGEVLYRNGQPCDALYLLWEGGLSLSIRWPNGSETALGDIGPGQFTGVAAVIDPGPALLTVTAARPSILLRLDHDSLSRLRERYPRLGGELLKAFSLDLTEWLRRYEDCIAQQPEPDSVAPFFRASRFGGSFS